MSKIETGGPAFPTGDMVESDQKGMLHGYPISSAGMTLRDYFAGQALAGLFSYIDSETLHRVAASQQVSGHVIVCRMAYDYADAMLAARGGDRD